MGQFIADFYYPLTTGVLFLVLIANALVKRNVSATAAMIAMAFSVAGDIILGKLFGKFVFGLSTFFVAQIFYLAAFSTLPVRRYSRWSFVAVASAITLFFVVLVYLMNDNAMRLPVAVYGALLAVNVVLAYRVQRGWMLFIGIFLFFISDAEICINRFVVPLQYGQLINSATYLTGQALIALHFILLPKKRFFGYCGYRYKRKW